MFAEDRNRIRKYLNVFRYGPRLSRTWNVHNLYGFKTNKFTRTLCVGIHTIVPIYHHLPRYGSIFRSLVNDFRRLYTPRITDTLVFLFYFLKCVLKTCFIDLHQDVRSESMHLRRRHHHHSFHRWKCPTSFYLETFPM